MIVALSKSLRVIVIVLVVFGKSTGKRNGGAGGRDGISLTPWKATLEVVAEPATAPTPNAAKHRRKKLNLFIR